MGARMAAVVAAVGVVAMLLLFGAAPAGAQTAGAEGIDHIGVVLTASRDGKLAVVETIAYNFGFVPRHGIIRIIPDRLRFDSHHDRRYPITVTSVTASAGNRRSTPLPVSCCSARGVRSLVGSLIASWALDWALDWTAAPASARARKIASAELRTKFDSNAVFMFRLVCRNVGFVGQRAGCRHFLAQRRCFPAVKEASACASRCASWRLNIHTKPTIPATTLMNRIVLTGPAIKFTAWPNK